MKYRSITIIVFLSVSVTNAKLHGKQYEISEFEKSVASQQTLVWCWAACVEMLVEHVSKDRTTTDQTQIVTRNYGVPAALPAYSWEQIRQNLNVLIPNRDGMDWQMNAKAHYRQLMPTEVIEELSNNRPFLLGVNGQSHVVVCYGAEINRNAFGQLQVDRIRIFDPFPGKGSQWLTRQQWPQHVRYRWESSITFKIEKSSFVSAPKQLRKRISSKTPQVTARSQFGSKIAAEIKFHGHKAPKFVLFRILGRDPRTGSVIFEDISLPVAPNSNTEQWLPLVVNTRIVDPRDTGIMSIRY